MKIKTLCALALLALTSSLAIAQAVTRCGGPNNALYINSPNFHFDVCHTGYNPYEHTIGVANVANLELAWSFSGGNSTVVSSPALVNGVLYFGNYADYTVYAVNASTGAMIWKYTTFNLITSSPAVARGIVYIGSYDGGLYALNAADGTLIWRYATSEPIESSPTVADGVVYFGSGDANVYAVKAATGALVWKYATGAAVASSPAVVNGLVYIGSSDHYLYALNAVTGTVLWKYQTVDQIFDSSPAVVNGTVYVGVDSNTGPNVYAVNALTGAPVWTYTTGSDVLSSPAVANGTVYITSQDGYLFALDTATGTLVWKSGLAGTSATVANGIVYVGCVAAELPSLCALDASTGAVLWSHGLLYSQSTPVVANGMVFMGTGGDNGPTVMQAFRLLGQ